MVLSGRYFYPSFDPTERPPQLSFVAMQYGGPHSLRVFISRHRNVRFRNFRLTSPKSGAGQTTDSTYFVSFCGLLVRSIRRLGALNAVFKQLGSLDGAGYKVDPLDLRWKLSVRRTVKLRLDGYPSSALMWGDCLGSGW